MKTASRAKLFRNGNSQAVRLPKEFRFEGSEVFVRKEGEAVVLEPVKPRQWPKGFFRSVRIIDPEFERPEQGKVPPAPDLT